MFANERWPPHCGSHRDYVRNENDAGQECEASFRFTIINRQRILLQTHA